MRYTLESRQGGDLLPPSMSPLLPITSLPVPPSVSGTTGLLSNKASVRIFWKLKKKKKTLLKLRCNSNQDIYGLVFGEQVTKNIHHSPGKHWVLHAIGPN